MGKNEVWCFGNSHYHNQTRYYSLTVDNIGLIIMEHEVSG